MILEFDVPSYRTDAALQRGQALEVNRQERLMRDTWREKQWCISQLSGEFVAACWSN